MTDEKKKKFVCKDGSCEECVGDECKNECEKGHKCGDGECGGDEHKCEDVECVDCK